MRNLRADPIVAMMAVRRAEEMAGKARTSAENALRTRNVVVSLIPFRADSKAASADLNVSSSLHFWRNAIF